jgi:adenine-specific DNA-methyltransferase
MKKNINSKKITLENYTHGAEKRINNPQVGLVSSATDTQSGSKTYLHDPHIDPQLDWAGKKEGTSFDVANVSLHIHERIDPQRIAKSFLKKKDQPTQTSLFENPYNELPLLKAVHFYQHEQDWSNRLIAGDSLLVMNSLLQKEGMAGKIQMIYIDPPYGIKFNSNFQPFVNKRDVKDNNDDDIPAEPETINAFRDTWELGIHSYLSYIKDRLLLASELLHESGSCFIQINDNNLNYVVTVMEEVFGKDNFINIIPFRKRASYLEREKGIFELFDYIIWFAKDAKKVKVNKLYQKIDLLKNFEKTKYVYYDNDDGSERIISLTDFSKNDFKPGLAYRRHTAIQESSDPKNVFSINIDGKEISPPSGYEWKANKEGMDRLLKLNRLRGTKPSVMYKIRFDDFPYQPLNNLWDDTSAEQNPIYAVQTDKIPVQRCLLMSTDPGDLVLDITCGSGTTAFVAEQMGRRWITCDTSRVAVSLAKQRLMTASYDYYELAYPNEGIRSGFKYKNVSHITLTSLAQGHEHKSEVLYDQPLIERGKVRVAGPFTVEAVPCLGVKPFDNMGNKLQLTGTEIARSGLSGTLYQWIDELKATGIRATEGKYISFGFVEPSVGTKYIHAIADIINEQSNIQNAAISFGPDYGPLEQRQVEETINEARKLKNKPDLIIFAAFHFDPEAAKDIDQINSSNNDFTILKAQMSVDLLTNDLRKKRSSNQSYWLIGQPDIEIIKGEKDTIQVKVNGFDYYNPITGEIESGATKQVAMWMLDTDYDEQSIFPEQVFFPVSDTKRDWTKLAKALNGTVDEDLLELYTGIVSKPFKPGENKKIAVKIIDNRGIESFVVKSL